jgi:methionyl aminopeptidase
MSTSGIIFKNARDLEKMREGGRLLSAVLAELRGAVRPGISTYDLDQLARSLVTRAGGYPSFLGYRGFPASLCAAVNEEVVHGIPKRCTVLKEGDLVKLDLGVRWKGFHVDSATTVPVGRVPEEVERLLAATRESLWCGIHAIRPKARLADIARAVQERAERDGFSVVRNMVGHGVGKKLHEPPQVPNFVDPDHPDVPLLEGMTLAIEPMVNAGGADVETLLDQWTVVSKDRSLSAHFEHTVAITRGGCEVLTLGPHDPGP